MRYGIMLLFLFATGTVSSQTTIIKGIVKSKSDLLGISGINITLKDPETGTLLKYTQTNDQGEYTISYSSSLDSITITASGLTIEKQIKTLFNKSQFIDFIVNTQAIALKEIIVNLPKIRKLSDTISYTVDGFAAKNDRTIGDVLKKMPGIEVKQNGIILYNNKPINKFYIEDKDLLQGRYGIATNNIEAKDVSIVEVLENHQPIKALKDKEFSEEAALNLKLKDSAKGILSMNAKLGVGVSPALWNNELFSMYFNRNRQNINTYKGNNTGEDPREDLVSHYSAQNSTNYNVGLSVQSPSTPAINQRRYLFNQAHAFSINNLWTYGKETQVNVNISYLNDSQYRGSYSRSVYYLPGDSLLTIEERLASKHRINQLNTSIQFKTNKDNYYLENTFSFKGQWNQAESTAANADTILQQLKIPSFDFSNNLSLIKNYKSTSLRFYSYVSYNRSPQLLIVRPELYGFLFNELNDPVQLSQSLAQNRLTANNKVSFGFNKNPFKHNYTIGMNANLQQLHSNLQAQNEAGNSGILVDSLRNELKWNKSELYFTPDYSFVKNHIRLQAILPFNYTYLHTNDQLIQQRKTLSRLFFNPALLLNYDINPFLALSANVRYNSQSGEAGSLFTGYLMESYRSLVKNEGQLPTYQNQTYSVNLNYRHPIHQLFINFGSNYSRNHFNLLYSYDYTGILSVKKTFNIPNVAATYNVYGRISKGINAINGVVTLDANYTKNSGSQISQDKVLLFKSKTYLLKPTVTANVKSWASLNYSFQFTASKNKISNNSYAFETIYANTQFTQLNFFPLKRLTITLAHEYFYSSERTIGNKMMSFVDTNVKYTYRNMELALDYINVFNAKQFVSASYLNTNTYYYAYDLRPAQVLLKLRFKII